MSNPWKRSIPPSAPFRALIVLFLLSSWALNSPAAETSTTMDPMKVPVGHGGDCTACHGKQRPNTYIFDADKSVVIAQFYGIGAPIPALARRIRGGFTFDVAALQNSSVTMELDTSAVQSTDGLVNDFLRSSQFLDSERYPKVRFASTAIHKKSDKTFTVSGNLSLHGITRASQLEVTFDGGGSDSLLSDTYASFHAFGTVRCRDFGISLCAPTDTVQLDIRVLGRTAQ